MRIWVYVQGLKILGHKANPTRTALKSFHGLTKLTLEIAAFDVSSAVSPNDRRTRPVLADTLFFKMCTTLHTYHNANYGRYLLTGPFFSGFSLTTEPTAERVVQFNKKKKIPIKRIRNMVNRKAQCKRL